MSTTIRTNHGEYTGTSVDSIVRREYGDDATINWSADANAPEVGQIIGPQEKTATAWPVLARLIWIDED